MIDQLSRHPELTTAWIDGTLRELPESEFGFGVFDDTALSAPPAPIKTNADGRTDGRTDGQTGGRTGGWWMSTIYR